MYRNSTALPDLKMNRKKTGEKYNLNMGYMGHENQFKSYGPPKFYKDMSHIIHIYVIRIRREYNVEDI